MRKKRRVALLAVAALVVLLLLATMTAPAIADEALPEEELQEVAADEADAPVMMPDEEVVGAPLVAAEDEALPEEAPPEAAADESEPLEANSGGTVSVYRLFNRRTSEHLYTTSRSEYEGLPRKTHGDWMWEGVAWVAPKRSSTPVYRLYNRGLGDHHYTTSKGERDALTRKGWRYEGIAFYSDDSHRVPLYRVYNGRLRAGQHHYTTSKGERDSLVGKSGWRNEGVGWYGISGGHAEDLSRYSFAYDVSSLGAADKNYLAYLLHRLDVLGLVNPSSDLIYFRQSRGQTLIIYVQPGNAYWGWTSEDADMYVLNKGKLTIEMQRKGRGELVVVDR